MKVVITAQQGSLDSAVDPRFGRCQYLLLLIPILILGRLSQSGSKRDRWCRNCGGTVFGQGKVDA